MIAANKKAQFHVYRKKKVDMTRRQQSLSHLRLWVRNLKKTRWKRRQMHQDSFRGKKVHLKTNKRWFFWYWEIWNKQNKKTRYTKNVQGKWEYSWNLTLSRLSQGIVLQWITKEVKVVQDFDEDEIMEYEEEQSYWRT